MPTGRIGKTGRTPLLAELKTVKSRKALAFNRYLHIARKGGVEISDASQGDKVERLEMQALNERDVSVEERKRLHNSSEALQSWVAGVAETGFDQQPESIPEVVASLSGDALVNVVNSCVVERPELLEDEPSVHHDHSETYLNIRNKLDQYKEQLGGTPNYDNGKPVLNRSRLLFGHAWEPVRNWVSKAITRKWGPAVFWRELSKALGHIQHTGQTYGALSQYEFCVLTLESIGHIERNLPEIERRLKEDDNAAAYFSIKTGWAIHPGLSSGEKLIRGLRDYLEAFRNEFAKAEFQGELEGFFTEAIRSGDICFEARNRTLENYIVGCVTRYTHDSSLEEILDENIGKFLEQWYRGSPRTHVTSTDALNWLLAQDITGYCFYGGAGENFAESSFSKGLAPGRKVLTETMIRQYLEYLVVGGIFDK